MTREEWARLLKTYRTPKRTTREVLEGIADHLDTPCRTGKTQTVVTPASGARHLPPFHEEPTVCDRGTSGCNLRHDDHEALVYARMGLERITEQLA